MRLTVIMLFGLLAMLPLTGAQAQANAIQLEPKAAERLQITEVASGLAFPMGMIPLPDGSLLVATSPSASGNFYNSTGTLLRLYDSDGDGSFDQQAALTTELPGSLVAVARYKDIVVTTSAQSGNEQIMFFRRGEHWRDPLVQIDSIRLHFVNAIHQSYGLATRPNPENKNAFDLVFNIGAGGNNTDGANVRALGPIDASLDPSSLYLMTVTDDGSATTFAEPIQIARGLRNAATFAFQPGSGDLWIGENGIDGLSNPIDAFSADELDVIPADQIGKTVIDFGFPDAYVAMDTGELVGPDTAAVNFRPINGSEAEGIAGIVFVPASFPREFAGGILAGFHGQFDLTGIANEENPVRWINPDTGDQFDLILNDSTGVGHLDSMTASKDVIYIADFCDGSLSTSTGCGIIYRLSPRGPNTA